MNASVAVSAANLSELLHASAARHPSRDAVVDGDRVVTYGELYVAATDLARTLADAGVEPGDRVAVLLPKSIDAVVAIHAILEVGACYVPLDVDSPDERLVHIAGDCAVRCFVTTAAAVERCSELAERAVSGAGVVAAGSGWRVVEEARRRSSDGTPATDASADRLAYILYTSGSTGMPKGVMLTHANAMAFVDWAAAAFDVTAEDRLSSHAPFHFDLSIFDLYVAAHAGAAVHLVPRVAHVFPASLAKFIESAGITIWYSVPSALSLLVQRSGVQTGRLSSLRWVLFAGEIFATPVVRALQGLVPAARLANLYGPTETNVCTWYEVGALPTDDPLPIGGPIDGVDVLLVGDDGLRVPDGEVGEVVVAGPTVMGGYWGDADRTARALVAHPEDPRRLVYRTGDLARARPDGLLDFVGRRDDQVKCRGHRIELGEVEAAVGSHPAVFECAVIPVADEIGSNRLHAFVVLGDGDGADASDVARHCRERVPAYMVPDSWVVVDALPRTSTGKLDRVTLRELHLRDDG